LLWWVVCLLWWVSLLSSLLWLLGGWGSAGLASSAGFPSALGWFPFFSAPLAGWVGLCLVGWVVAWGGFLAWSGRVVGLVGFGGYFLFIF
jgi:hypothetical protein